MALKLYFAPGACSFVPHTLLEAAGEAFEPALVKLHKGENYTPEYKAINPRSQVPVLVDGDETITQIVAIATYLNDRFPQLGFLPREPLARGRVMETLAWMNNSVHPTFTHYFMPFKFTSNEAIHGDLKAHAQQVYAGMLGELDAIVKKAEDAGHAYLGGENFSPLDPYALTLLRWGTIAGIDPTQYASLWPFVQRIAMLPHVQRAMERERLQLNLYKPAA